MQEYMSIVINSSNRAIDWILNTIVEPHKNYFKDKLSTYDSDGNIVTEWTVPTLTPITEDTPDTFVIGLPDLVIHLVALRASHWVWLDDDKEKAMTYWNEYEDMKTDLITNISMPQKLTFTGGVYFG